VAIEKAVTLKGRDFITVRSKAFYKNRINSLLLQSINNISFDISVAIYILRASVRSLNKQKMKV
jgi:hypothetical protein